MTTIATSTRISAYSTSPCPLFERTVSGFIWAFPSVERLDQREDVQRFFGRGEARDTFLHHDRNPIVLPYPVSRERGRKDGRIVLREREPIKNEIPQAVGDQPAVVSLDALQDVRGRAEHERRARVNGRVRLGTLGGGDLRPAFESEVEQHDDHVGLRARGGHVG